MFKVKCADSIMMLVRLDLNPIVSLFQHKCEVSETVSTTTLVLVLFCESLLSVPMSFIIACIVLWIHVSSTGISSCAFHVHYCKDQSQPNCPLLQGSKPTYSICIIAQYCNNQSQPQKRILPCEHVSSIIRHWQCNQRKKERTKFSPEKDDKTTGCSQNQPILTTPNYVRHKFAFSFVLLGILSGCNISNSLAIPHCNSNSGSTHVYN